ncbi:MAG: calcium/sodium antiporter [Acidimicrobiales bacterium]|jgi:cation:H+ antiporter|nr:calcium/sodium antiporter [Acidimicrobiales bacterium]
MVLAALASLAGLALLATLADQFVMGAARLAAVLRVSPVVVGAVVVGFGTSAPEAVVSALAASGGDLELAVGNVAGSNAANVSLVLGLAAVLVPLGVASGTLRREVPLAAGACAAFAALAWNGLSRLDGLVLLTLLAVALAVVIRGGRSGEEELSEEVDEFVADDAAIRPGREAGRVLLGLVGILAGAQLLVWGAETIAEELSVPPVVIGLTVVAIGTSLPELVTAVVAARRGEDELIVGNVVGSNLFNSLGVAAAAAFAGPGGYPDPGSVHLALVSMAVLVVLSWVFMGRRLQVTRGEGIALLVSYGASLVVVAVVGR